MRTLKKITRPYRHAIISWVVKTYLILFSFLPEKILFFIVPPIAEMLLRIYVSKRAINHLNIAFPNLEKSKKKKSLIIISFLVIASFLLSSCSNNSSSTQNNIVPQNPGMPANVPSKTNNIRGKAVSSSFTSPISSFSFSPEKIELHWKYQLQVILQTSFCNRFPGTPSTASQSVKCGLHMPKLIWLMPRILMWKASHQPSPLNRPTSLKSIREGISFILMKFHPSQERHHFPI